MAINASIEEGSCKFSQ